VADGIDTWSDFLTVRDLGFDLVAAPLSKSIERLSIAGGGQPTETSGRPAKLSNRDSGVQWR
jgi:hypothetical protein